MREYAGTAKDLFAFSVGSLVVPSPRPPARRSRRCLPLPRSLCLPGLAPDQRAARCSVAQGRKVAVTLREGEIYEGVLHSWCDTSETPARHLRDTSETLPRRFRDTPETLPRRL